MRLTIHTLIAALESADVWDTREIGGPPVAETIATLREYAFRLTLETARGTSRASLRSLDDTPLTGRRTL